MPTTVSAIWQGTIGVSAGATNSEAESLDRREARADVPSVSFVCAPFTLFWVAALSACIAAVAYLQLDADVCALIFAVALFCVQGGLADFMGVRIDPEFVRVPNRPWPEVPVVVLGRLGVRLDDIERIAVRDGRMFANAILRTRTHDTLGLHFQSRKKRREFHFLLAELRPSITVVKAK
jgi:hypothetical protein